MEMSPSSQQVFASILFERTGQQLSENRQWRVATALSSIVKDQGFENAEQLAFHVAENESQSLQQAIAEALLNNETYFFRDRPTFDQLPRHIFPALGEQRRSDKALKIWSTGCSTGQEVHSLAMEFAANPMKWSDWSISILGTDISSRAITTARKGLYSQFEVQRGLSIMQTLRHFSEVENGWQISSDIARYSDFEQHNVLSGSPRKTKFDLILCRNVLLYFDSPTRRVVFDLLREALAPDGFLMLGAGETTVGRTDKFVPAGDLASLFKVAS